MVAGQEVRRRREEQERQAGGAGPVKRDRGRNEREDPGIRADREEEVLGRVGEERPYRLDVGVSLYLLSIGGRASEDAGTYTRDGVTRL